MAKQSAPLPYAAPVAALLAAEGTRRGLPHPLPEQALADRLGRSQASVGQAKRRGAGVTVRKLAELCSALGWRLVLSVERDAAVLSVERDAAVLADIVGPARAASVGARCEPWLFVAELRVRLSCKLPATDLMGCSAARGAGESEEQKR